MNPKKFLHPLSLALGLAFATAGFAQTAAPASSSESTFLRFFAADFVVFELVFTAAAAPTDSEASAAPEALPSASPSWRSAFALAATFVGIAVNGQWGE